jgi:hypothetical protein
MNLRTSTLLIAVSRIRVALAEWGSRWSASQAKAAEDSFARRIDPITGRRLSSWPGISRYH